MRFTVRVTWPRSAAANYAFIALGLDDYYDERGGGAPAVVDCPECGTCVLVTEAVTASERPSATPLCFSCGNTFSDLVECEGGCGSLLDVAPDGDALRMCTDCVSVRYAKF